MKNLREIKPSDFILKGEFFGTRLNKCEAEMVARNLIIISKYKNNDEFLKNFTFEDYKKNCSHNVNSYDGEGFYTLLRKGCLSKDDEKYNFTTDFFYALKKYIHSDIVEVSGEINVGME